jgi:C_GCAxxG_C_C family probable redox protein
VGQEKAEISGDSAIKAMGAFGGGFAATGGPCGLLIGAIALISNLYSRANLDGKENPKMWGLSQKYIKKFEELTATHGGTNCSDIAGVNWHDRAAVKEYYNNPDSSRKTCIDLVGEAAFTLGELLEQTDKRPPK